MQRNSQEIFESLNTKTIPARNQDKSILQAAQEKNDTPTLNEIYAEAKSLFKQKFTELSAAAMSERMGAAERAALTSIEEGPFGFDITEDDSITTQRTILYWAIATFQPEEEIKNLLEAGNKVKSNYSDQSYFINRDGRTVFSAALELENIIAVQTLLADNPRLAINNLHQSGNKPAHYLVSTKKHRTLEVLLQCTPDAALAAAGDSVSPLHLAAKANDLDSALIIIKHIPEPEHATDKNYLDFRDADGNTALHFAASNGNKILVAELLKRGADTTLLTGKSNTVQNVTALQLACINGQNEVVRTFMQHNVFETKLHRVNREQLSPKIKAAMDLKDYIDECRTKLAAQAQDNSPAFNGVVSQGLFAVARKVVNNPEQYTPGDSIQRKMQAAQNLLNKIINGSKDPWSELSNEDQRTLNNSSYYSKVFSSDEKTTYQIVTPLREHSNSRSNSRGSSSDEESDYTGSPRRYH